MTIKIIQIGDPILEKPTKPVKDIKDPKVQEVIDDMLKVCKREEKRSAGLSANQIGENWSISICRRTDLEGEGERSKNIPFDQLWEVMINPKIINSSNNESIIWEGCLSIGETEKDTLWGPVSRPESVEFEYTNRVGETKNLHASGFFSHIVQHEIDHLKGILFLSYVKNPQENLWKAPDFNTYIQRVGDYPDVK